MESETPVSERAKLRVPDHVLTRRASGETVLLNLENEQYYGLEGVGSRMWELVEAGTTIDDAATALHREYGVPRDATLEDIRILVADLRQNGLVIVDQP